MNLQLAAKPTRLYMHYYVRFAPQAQTAYVILPMHGPQTAREGTLYGPAHCTMYRLQPRVNAFLARLLHVTIAQARSEPAFSRWLRSVMLTESKHFASQYRNCK